MACIYNGVCSSLVALFSWQQVTHLAALMAHCGISPSSRYGSLSKLDLFSNSLWICVIWGKYVSLIWSLSISIFFLLSLSLYLLYSLSISLFFLLSLLSSPSFLSSLSLLVLLSIQFNSIQGLYWHGKHVLTLPKQVR